MFYRKPRYIGRSTETIEDRSKTKQIDPHYSMKMKSFASKQLIASWEMIERPPSFKEGQLGIAQQLKPGKYRKYLQIIHC
jgi:hypothetical protein